MAGRRSNQLEGRTIDNDKDKCEIMNKFFIQKVKSLQDRLNIQQTEDPFKRLYEKIGHRKLNFTFRRLEVKEVEHIMRKMKKTRACGLDGISTDSLRPIIHILAPVLSIVVNDSLQEGKFPECFKCARVTCVYKGKGFRSDPNNYRPISNLPVFGKIQEIAVDVQLRKFCEKHDLFGRQQNGFRKCRSTTTALLTATINWRANRERRKYQGVLLFDLSAAYDMLSKDIFLKKAAICGLFLFFCE